MYSIPRNNYVEPKEEVRPYIVQELLNYYHEYAHLDEGKGLIFWSGGKYMTYAVGWKNGVIKLIDTTTNTRRGCFDKIINLRTCEIQALFDAWISFGYHIYKHESNECYRLSARSTPPLHYRKVTKFTERIQSPYL